MQRKLAQFWTVSTTRGYFAILKHKWLPISERTFRSIKSVTTKISELLKVPNGVLKFIAFTNSLLNFFSKFMSRCRQTDRHTVVDSHKRLDHTLLVERFAYRPLISMKIWITVYLKYIQKYYVNYIVAYLTVCYDLKIHIL